MTRICCRMLFLYCRPMWQDETPVRSEGVSLRGWAARGGTKTTRARPERLH